MSSTRDDPGAPRTRAWKRLGLVALSTLCGLAALEGLCRWHVHRIDQHTLEAAFALPFEPSATEQANLRDIIRPVANDRIAYELRPNLNAVEFKGAQVTTNSRGFRSPEIPATEPPSTVTIVGLGDSIQFGQGVADGECYLDQLVELLRERRPQVKWRLLNTSAPGYNTVMEVETLEEKALVFSPDLVILGVCGNDYSPPVYVRTARDVTDPSHSFLLEVLRERISGESSLARESQEAIRYRSEWSRETGAEAPPRYAELYGPEPFETAADQLAGLAREHEFLVLAFATIDYGVVPEMMDSLNRRGFPQAHLQQTLERHYQSSTGEEFSWEGYANSELVVSEHDGHPSPLQHRMAAEHILARLEELKLVDALVERARER